MIIVTCFLDMVKREKTSTKTSGVRWLVSLRLLKYKQEWIKGKIPLLYIKTCIISMVKKSV